MPNMATKMYKKNHEMDKRTFNLINYINPHSEFNIEMKKQEEYLIAKCTSFFI